MQLIDTHVHLNFDVLQADLPAISERWRSVGVVHLVHSCVEPEEFAAIKAIADQFEEISFAVGLHPLDAQKWRDNSADQIESLARSDRRVVAIGEMGLDFVMHCWTGNPEETQWFLDLGFYISFSGIVTFKNSKTVQAAAQIVPSDRLLIETDCPFLSPNPHRGKPCEPSFVFHVAETVARLRGYPVETLAEQTTHNARNLFQLPS